MNEIFDVADGSGRIVNDEVLEGPELDELRDEIADDFNEDGDGDDEVGSETASEATVGEYLRSVGYSADEVDEMLTTYANILNEGIEFGSNAAYVGDKISEADAADAENAAKIDDDEIDDPTDDTEYEAPVDINDEAMMDAASEDNDIVETEIVPETVTETNDTNEETTTDDTTATDETEDSEAAADETPKINYDMNPDQIREMREGLSLSRAVLSKLSGLSTSVIWRAEHGDRKPITVEQRVTLINTLTNVDNEGVPESYRRGRGRKAASPIAVAAPRKRLESMSESDNRELAKVRMTLLESNRQLAQLKSDREIENADNARKIKRLQALVEQYETSDTDGLRKRVSELESDLTELEENTETLIASIKKQHATKIADLIVLVQTQLNEARTKKEKIARLTAIMDALN